MRGIGFLTTPIFARLLSQNEFGRYSNYTSWLGILTILASLNLEASLITAKTDFRETFDEYIGSMMALGWLSGACWIALISLFPDFLALCLAWTGFTCTACLPISFCICLSRCF